MLDPETGERITPRPGVDLAYPEQLVFDDLTGWRLAAMAAALVAGGLTMWLLLGALATRAEAYDALHYTLARRLEAAPDGAPPQNPGLLTRAPGGGSAS